MLKIRKLHLYLGTLFAPAIIFYALTGAFQTFQFHEEHEGRPPIPIFEKLAEIHKDQRVPQWVKPDAPPQLSEKPATTPLTPDAAGQATVQAEPAKPASQQQRPPRAPRRKPSLPFKIFAFWMSMGLIFTTCLGIYMAFRSTRDKWRVWAMLALGTGLPMVLLYL